MLKILLINPFFYINHPPLGLGYLSSYLKKYLNVPVEVLLFDESVDKSISPVLWEFKPDIIGISVVTPTFPHVKSLCKQIREITKAPLIAGGPHITAVPESISETSIDAGVIGEGEATFLELVECFLQTKTVKNYHIQGVVYPDEGKIIRTAPRGLITDLDSIPPPDRSLFKMAYYAKPKRLAHGLYAKGTSMMPSRGCPLGKCNFCSSYLIWGNSIRFFSPRYVANEIEAVVNEYDLNFIIFLDDNFTTSFKWLEALSLLLKERGLTKRISFDCESISTFMDERKAAILKEAGCVRVEFGFESGSACILDKLKSGKVSLEQNERAIAICKRHDIAVLGNVVFGYIDETPDQLEESAAWFHSQPIDYVAPHIYTPYPGTMGWRECVSRGIIDLQNLQWERFATGSTEENLIVNTMSSASEFLSRYHAKCAEFTLRNQTLIIDARLHGNDKADLYKSLVRDKDAFHVRSPDHSVPKTRLAWIKAGIYFKGLLAGIFWSMRLIKARGIKGTVWSLRNRLAPQSPLPCHLPFGAWWLARNEVMGKHIYFRASFEEEEQDFLLRFLRPGMTVFDAGAHGGLYTLLASKRVGSKGRIIAFEPSYRERGRLNRHIKINRCTNVQVEPVALSSREGFADLFVCMGQETGCNSLKPPMVSEPTRTVRVSITTLDKYMQRSNIDRVDFIKFDIEGAELEALKGATQLLGHAARPIVMCELADVRTKPWGYKSVEIYDFLGERDYTWFSFTSRGNLNPCHRKECFHENLIAVPSEKLGFISSFIEGYPNRAKNNIEFTGLPTGATL